MAAGASGGEIVCRDGSTAYAQAVRDALPHAVQVADRWRPWHGLCDAAGREVAAHSACWASATGLRQGTLAESTLDRWRQIHALREAGVGSSDCAVDGREPRTGLVELAFQDGDLVP